MNDAAGKSPYIQNRKMAETRVNGSAIHSGACNNPAPGPKGLIMVTLSKQPSKGISVVSDENWYGLAYFN